MRLLEIFKGKQNQEQTPNTGAGQEGVVNIDEVHQEAGEKLINVTAANTGQRPEQVSPAINQAPKLEQHKSGIPQFNEVPNTGRVTSRPEETNQVQSSTPAVTITNIVRQGSRDLQRGVTGEHIEEPPSFQPAKPVLDLHSKRTLEKAA